MIVTLCFYQLVKKPRQMFSLLFDRDYISWHIQGTKEATDT